MNRTDPHRFMSAAAAAAAAAVLLLAAGPAGPATTPKKAARATLGGCLPSGNGFLRARLRGALNLDLDWQNADLECEGSRRPDATGLRVSFAGPRHSDGRRLRLLFGIADVAEGHAGRELPTNLTVTFEGEQRLFATRGDDKCTVDELSQERVGDLGGTTRTWRVVARGFCTTPATTLGQDARILLSRFDFAGKVSIKDDVPPTPAAGTAR
jgi:hypothetical protein